MLSVSTTKLIFTLLITACISTYHMAEESSVHKSASLQSSHHDTKTPEVNYAIIYVVICLVCTDLKNLTMF